MSQELELTGAMQQPSVTDGPGVSLRPRFPVAMEDTELLGGMHIPESEEVLIVDSRANVGPALQVEHKLSNLLRNGPLPVSHARMSALFGGRRSR